jgi:hypothetical protein
MLGGDPQRVRFGDKVIGGTVNGTGAIVMQAERVGSETMLAQIVEMVAQAQRSRAPIQRLADRVSAYFVQAVVAVAALAFVAWPLWGPPPAMAHALVTVVAVLIIACPCALGLATPMSIQVGVGRGAQAGVLIKNAEALERFEKVDTLVIDKTGTLTEGKPRVITVETGDGIGPDELLRLAASPALQRALPWRGHRRGCDGARARAVRCSGVRRPAGASRGRSMASRSQACSIAGLREWHRMSGVPEYDERHDVMGRAHDVGHGPLWPAGDRAPRPGDRRPHQVSPQLIAGVSGSSHTNRRCLALK